MANRMRPIHPGEILREEYLLPLGMSASALAHALGVPANRVSAIVAGRRGVTADTALLLAHAFETSPEFWMNLQQAHDLRLAEKAAARAPGRSVLVVTPRAVRKKVAGTRSPSPRRTSSVGLRPAK